MSIKEQIGIGIIGTGFGRTTQIPAFRACPSARLTAVASGTRANAERVAAEYNIPFIGDNWRSVVRQSDVDLVCVTTPPATHAEIVIAALEAGKHVLCEKPMAMNAKEADKMRQAARMSGRLALIDHELRFLPGRVRAYELLRSGALGTVRHVKLTFRYDKRATADQRWDWWSDEKMGGGILGALGSHAVDGFRWLLGAEIAQVFAQLATHVKERYDAKQAKRFVTADDECNMLLRFKDTALTNATTGTIALSTVEAGTPEHRLEIYGAQGALMIGGNGELWQSAVGENAWQPLNNELGDIAEGLKPSGWARGFTVFAREIVEALREGRTKIPQAATFDDGFLTQQVLDAARLSQEQGRWIRPDSERGTFYK